MADSCFDNTMYEECRWLTETSESLQIKQSKASRETRVMQIMQSVKPFRKMTVHEHWKVLDIRR